MIEFFFEQKKKKLMPNLFREYDSVKMLINISPFTLIF